MWHTCTHISYTCSLFENTKRVPNTKHPRLSNKPQPSITSVSHLLCLQEAKTRHHALSTQGPCLRPSNLDMPCQRVFTQGSSKSIPHCVMAYLRSSLCHSPCFRVPHPREPHGCSNHELAPYSPKKKGSSFTSYEYSVNTQSTVTSQCVLGLPIYSIAFLMNIDILQ